MNPPQLIIEESFQTAWAKAIIALSKNRWELWNLVVQIKNPSMLNSTMHEEMRKFALSHKKLIEPDKVAYTIFPFKSYKSGITTREKLYKAYWRYFKITRKMEHSGWGTYFERMIRYPTTAGEVDQLGSIIDNINSRRTNYCAAHVIMIPQPNRDLNKIMGAPCLNYLTIQVENPEDHRKIINLLAVYRNHDFRSRAYGNYLGLCKLLHYIAKETNSSMGSLTCVSSHADVPNDKRKLLQIANSFISD
ncbi:thymidylate synthase [Desulfitobacterium sp. THU1]|uniref:thymidylate synthase n=1 Tax=Desulfitobacterium sp. THU1 TaxID=3138072 RepID=UPI00311FDA0B